MYSLVIKPDDTNFFSHFFKNWNTCPNKAIVYNLIHIFIYYQILYVLIECIHLKFMYCIYNDLMSHRITNPLKHSRSQNMLFVKKKKLKEESPLWTPTPYPYPTLPPWQILGFSTLDLILFRAYFVFWGLFRFSLGVDTCIHSRI